MDGFESYVSESIAPLARKGRRLSVYVGLAVLLAAASLVAVNTGGGGSASIARVIHPKAGSACTTPPNGFAYTNTVDGTTMKVCISQEGNINQIEYPTLGSTQIAWDGYCVTDTDSGTRYTDYSPGSGISFSGWAAATLTVVAANQVNMTRTTLDGKYQLTEFIKINFQPRSVFVGMTVKNLDSVSHDVVAYRTVAPAIDGSAADDQYNEYGIGALLGATQYGRTGVASQSPGPGANALAFGLTQTNGLVRTAPASSFAAFPCTGQIDSPGPIGGGNRAFNGIIATSTGIKHFTLAPNASANVGKFVYRMV
jgi:hypothetical protein